MLLQIKQHLLETSNYPICLLIAKFLIALTKEQSLQKLLFVFNCISIFFWRLSRRKIRDVYMTFSGLISSTFPKTYSHESLESCLSLLTLSAELWFPELWPARIWSCMAWWSSSGWPAVPLQAVGSARSPARPSNKQNKEAYLEQNSEGHSMTN